MPKNVDADRQREDIRNAARRVFAKRGVRGTGLTQVAQAATMGRSSLYHYDPDKESLLTDLLREMLAGELLLFRSCLLREGAPVERSMVCSCSTSSRARCFPSPTSLRRRLPR